MKTLYLILFSFISGSTFSQSDTFQSDSTYKLNRVKERRMSSPGTKAQVVYQYNLSGQITAFFITDNESGKKLQGITKYSYSNQHQLMADTSYLGDTIDATSEYKYDKEGNVISKIAYDRDKILSSDVKYSYNPDSEIETFYFTDGSIQRQQTSLNEKRNISYNFEGFSIEENGDTSKWNYHFENTFAQSGRLIKRVQKNSPTTVLYEYDKNGLLIKRITIIGESKTADVFKYKYW